MNVNSHRKLIIIGSGPAGLTAGVYAGRANLNPIIIEGKNPGGQLMGTSLIENWPGEKSIMGPRLMMNMKAHAEQFGCEFAAGDVVKVNFSKAPFSIWTSKDVQLQADSIIIASGAVPNKLGCPGEEEYWGKGVTTCAVCDGAFYPDKEAIIIGGGDTAMEDASFMTKFTKKITIIHILDKLTASVPMQKRVLDNPNIKIIYSSTVSSIRGNGNHITELTVTNQITKQETTLNADIVFVAIGLKPNTSMFKDQLALDRMGYLELTNKTHTSVPGIFAAGDVADYRYKQAIVSAGSGCMAALDAERYLTTK
jgi:thioredoxin reductase (NADPH)